MGSLGPDCQSRYASEPIAIIGMSSKFAGDATNTDKLWQMLAEGRSGWTEFPASRFRSEGVYHPNNERLNTTHVKGAHFLQEDVGLFDAAFFSYSSETASSLDPQYRLQLESAYEALENAGIPLTQIAGSNTSVFTGVFVHDYRDALLRDADNLPRLMATGTGVPMMSNRISHFFDLRGASMTIETACSSGMVATHQGIQSLRTGEADMSIVGGANLTLNPDMFKALGSAGFLSADGKSYAFDSRASGYGRGEGVATIVMKRLSDALAAGDPIRAVIRSSLLNQDGKTETITTPSLEAQIDLIRQCYARAGLDPRDTQYFEAHGTGTQAGDTVEARAIATVFSSNQDPLLIGSIKTNIGHTEAASGLASIIKTALALEKGVIPASINFEKPNPKLSLEDWHLKLVRQLQEWPAARTRRASINNFGYGGANAHIVLEDGASWAPSLVEDTYHKESNNTDSKVLVLSGKDEQACRSLVSNLADYLQRVASTEDEPARLLDSLAFTLGQRRTRFSWVAAHPVPVTEGIEAVANTLLSPKFKPYRSSRRPRIGMVFTGQGAQWWAMGRELRDAYPVYKASLDEADAYIRQFGADWSLVDELSRDAASSRINESGLSTPICVAVQISLVRLLESWGVVPAAVTSHSSGEIAAAYTVGALSYKDAMAYAYHRAVLAADTSLRGPVKGGMVAIGLGREETEAYLRRLTGSGKAMVACVNSPSSTTVSGDFSAVKELEELANADGVFARLLKVETAWHSHHMTAIANVYVEALDNIKRKNSRNGSLIAYSSPVTGGRVTKIEEVARPEHWVKSLVQPVQFVDAFTDMVLGDLGNSTSNIDVVVEVGPHTALGGPIQQILGLPAFKGLQIPYFGCLVRKTDAKDTMQALAANLLQQGYPLDMDAVNFPHGRGPRVKVLTGLPSYPWNHQVRHWVEPRFNKALRERSVAPHHLLGSLVEGTNLESPTWRHTLRISESPWTRDHAIQSNVVYPAAGYICLAIEATKQLHTLNHTKTEAKEVWGYRLRDVDFLQALMIPDTSDGIEIQTSLRPVSDKDVALQGWKHFEVWSVTSDNRWTQHAKGLISLEYEASAKVSGPEAGDFSIRGYKRQIPPAELFANLKALGIGHGPVFQNMRHIVQSGSERRSVVLTAVPDTSVPNDLPREHVLHPVTLDSFITSPYSAVPGAASRETAAKVPRSVKSFWVSSNISHAPEHVFKAHSHIIRDDKHGMEADVIVANDGHDDNAVLLEMKGFSYQSLGRSVSLQHAEPWESQLCSSIHWHPDISVKLPATISSVKQELSYRVSSAEDAGTEISSLCAYFMQKALASLSDSDFSPKVSHYSKYYAWMKSAVQQAAFAKIDENDIDQIARERADGEMIRLLGSQLVPILRGELTPAEVMEQDKNLLSRFYNETPRAKRTSSQLSGLLRHLVHKNPRARILEIGASTGGVTGSALAALGTATSGGPHVSLYHYTDISDRAFYSAREDFADWADILAFDVLDIEHDPANQGFTVGSYDVVIASHAVSSTTTTVAGVLGNIKSLMKLGGALLFTEDVNPSIDVQFVQGLFPAWWFGESLPEEGIESSPLLSVPLWDRSLRQAGFTGIDYELHDSDDVDAFVSATILSTLLPHPAGQSGIDAGKVVIVTSEKAGNPPSEWLKALQNSIASSGTEVEGTEGKVLPSVHSIESTTSTAALYSDKICIFVGEINEPLLYNLDAASLEGIKAMSTGCKGLLWVTRGGAVDCERPEVSLATGFVRTLRNEYVGRKFITLDLSPKGSLWQESGHEAIAQVLQNAFGQPLPEHSSAPDKGPVELEYAERDGVILIPRVYHDVAKDDALTPKVLESEEDTQGITNVESFYQQNRPLCFQPELLVFGDDLSTSAYKDTLPPRLVEIMPRAYGAGMHPAEKAIGQECSGIITRVGSEASKHGYSVGDRIICLLQQSSFSSRAIVDWTSVVHMPTRLSFQEAASLPTAFLVAYLALVETARLKNTQTVLIHNGAGSIGQAAIMVAKHIGATVFTTVASPKQRDLLATEHGIPSHHIFDSANASFGTAVTAATNGRGVDVVLNSLTGPLLQTSFNLVAPLGHFIEVGRQDSLANSNLEMLPFTRGVSFSAIDVSSLLQHRANEMHRWLEEVVRLFELEALAPVSPIIEHNIGEIAQVFRLLHTEDDTGKRVLSVAHDEMVSVLPRTRAAARLSPDASYLIVGGNGGLGQAVAHWMVSRGAKNLVLLSRSAGQSPKMAVLAEELREAGCHRVLPVSCDVAREDDLARAMDTCAQEGLPPIRGVVHAAFVLHDSFVENMTLEDYKYTIQSKVSGAWNLHNQFNLPGDLDFFVLFSSINGILGYASQAAYSAAGAYEDALAHWRVKNQGLPAVSIDLSLVDGVGYVAEASSAEAMRKSLIKAGRRVINEEQVLASLELAIVSPYDPQFILGGINSGPGPHWDVDGDLGRDMRLLALKYRQSAAADGQGGDDNKAGSGGDSLSVKIASASSRDEAILVVGSAVAAMLADMFLVSVEEVDLNDSPSQQGIDSLVAVEVRNMLFSQAGAELSIFNIMQSPSLAQLVADVVDRSTFAKFAKS